MTDMETVKKELHKALLAMGKVKRGLSTQPGDPWDRAQSIFEDILLLEETLR